METKKIEIINYKEVYVTVDGTEFDNQEQAELYESSAFGVLKGRLVKMALATGDENEITGAGCEDNTSYVVAPKTEDEVATIQQLCYMKGYGDWKKIQADKAEVGKVLIVTLGFDDDGIWLTDLAEMVSKATAGKYEIVEKKGE